MRIRTRSERVCTTNRGGNLIDGDSVLNSFLLLCMKFWWALISAWKLQIILDRNSNNASLPTQRNANVAPQGKI